MSLDPLPSANLSQQTHKLHEGSSKNTLIELALQKHQTASKRKNTEEVIASNILYEEQTKKRKQEGETAERRSKYKRAIISPKHTLFTDVELAEAIQAPVGIVCKNFTSLRSLFLQILWPPDKSHPALESPLQWDESSSDFVKKADWLIDFPKFDEIKSDMDEALWNSWYLQVFRVSKCGGEVVSDEPFSFRDNNKSKSCLSMPTAFSGFSPQGQQMYMMPSLQAGMMPQQGQQMYMMPSLQAGMMPQQGQQMYMMPSLQAGMMPQQGQIYSPQMYMMPPYPEVPPASLLQGEQSPQPPPPPPLQAEESPLQGEESPLQGEYAPLPAPPLQGGQASPLQGEQLPSPAPPLQGGQPITATSAAVLPLHEY